MKIKFLPYQPTLPASYHSLHFLLPAVMKTSILVKSASLKRELSRHHTTPLKLIFLCKDKRNGNELQTSFGFLTDVLFSFYALLCVCVCVCMCFLFV